MNNKFYDITVIGGGPVGMFAAFYSGLRDANVQLIESLDHLGGQVSALYPYKTILDVGGHPGIQGKDLVKSLKKQMHMMHPTIRLNQAVRDIIPVDGGYQIVTDQTKTYTKAIVIAAGGGAFNPRKLRAKNAEKFKNKQLFYSVHNLDQFKNKTVLVAGGGNSAIDNALLLNKVAKKVYLLHRRDTFRGFERMVDRVKQSSIELITPYLIRELNSTDDGKLLVTAKKMRTENDFRRIKVDDVVVNFGFVATNQAMRKWSLKLKGLLRKVDVNQQMKTNENLVYAVGDVAKYKGKDTLIATGFGEVPIAVNSIMRALYPKRRLPIHSTMLKHWSLLNLIK